MFAIKYISLTPYVGSSPLATFTMVKSRPCSLPRSLQCVRWDRSHSIRVHRATPVMKANARGTAIHSTKLFSGGSIH